MKILSLALLLTAFSLAPTATRAQGESVPPARVAADAFVWKFAPPVGSAWQIRWFMRTETKSVTPFAVGTPDARAELVLMRRIVADYDVLNRDQFGATTARITFRQYSADISGTIDGGKLQPEKKDAAEKMNRALQNASITIKQSAAGEIWGISGGDAIQKRIANALDLDESKRQFAAQQISDSLVSANAIRQMLGLGQSPSYPLVTSESWPYAIEPLESNYRFELTGTRTLNRLTPDMAFIASNASYDGRTALAPAPLKRDEGDYSTDTSGIKASVRGASRVERSSGLTLESTSTWRIDSTILSRPTKVSNPPVLCATEESVTEIYTLLTPR